MVITATEFKKNLGKYLKMSLKEDVMITKNGKAIAKLSNPGLSIVDTIAGALEGKIPAEYNKNDYIEDKLKDYEDIH